MGISHLYVEDSLSEDIEVDEMVSQQTRMKCKKTLERTFQQINNRFELASQHINDIVEMLMGDMLTRPSIMVSLNEIGSIGDNTLDHSLNTTIYALCLGRQLRYDRNKLLELAQGTLLHDIGKTLLDSRILFKPGKLTNEEFAHVKRHTELGYEILNRDSRLPEASKIISLQHHERMDGSGYPNGLMGKELSEYARITTIVDVYEALTVDRCYHRAITPQRAVEVITEEAHTRLDFQLASIFMRNIAVYPNGTTVRLSTGEYAVVKEQNKSFPLRPVVRMIAMEGTQWVPREQVDLLTTLNLTIIGSDMTLPLA